MSIELEASKRDMLAALSLRAVAEGARFAYLDRLDSYFAGTQYDALKYDWDGSFTAYQGDVIQQDQGFYVPMASRRPCIRVDIPRLIVQRLTSMMLGSERFPQVNVLGDANAEDYVRALAKESRFPTKLIEARNYGGASGTAVMSFAFVNGKPRVEVHRSKHIAVLRWSDRYELRPAAVFKCYRYSKQEYSEGKPVKRDYYYARFWTETEEVVWDPIPADSASATYWFDSVPSYRVEHGYGECPVYWCQNLPNEETEDGISDFSGLCDDVDEFNRLFSATSKGAIANVDPTLVIKDNPTNNSGVVRKGSANAIWSQGGAEYLELGGTAIDAGMKLADRIERHILDVANVVLPDHDKIAAHAQSAAAMRVIYQPMLNQCDKLRAQYGDHLATPMLAAMLRAAKRTTGKGGPVMVTADGRLVQQMPVVVLPDRMETETKKTPEGNITVTRAVKRTPGEGESIELKWPPYFAATQDDIKGRVDSARSAVGSLISPLTAIKSVASDYGIIDAQQELDAIEEARAKAAALLPGPDGMLGAAPGEEDPSAEGGELPDGGMSVELAPTDMAAVVRVDEARAMADLPPFGGEDGKLTVAAFKAKSVAGGETEGTLTAEAEAPEGAKPEEPPPTFGKKPPAPEDESDEEAE